VDNDDSKSNPRLPPDVVALGDPSVLKIYANGFTLGLTNADAQMVLKLFGRPIAVLSFSYTLAKTMAEQFKNLVADWEARTGQDLQTTQRIDAAFSAEINKIEPH
jgi:hypothetical protein